uniref:Uncharacterized protein n=1 Tax=Opuntia streptacantha TaxID=393608 RepID=A0A7C8YRN9_OPUST
MDKPYLGSWHKPSISDRACSLKDSFLVYSFIVYKLSSICIVMAGYVTFCLFISSKRDQELKRFMVHLVVVIPFLRSFAVTMFMVVHMYELVHPNPASAIVM